MYRSSAVEAVSYARSAYGSFVARNASSTRDFAVESHTVANRPPRCSHGGGPVWWRRSPSTSAAADTATAAAPRIHGSLPRVSGTSSASSASLDGERSSRRGAIARIATFWIRGGTSLDGGERGASGALRGTAATSARLYGRLRNSAS